ncbi:putative S-adenosylmethionine uptake transporter [Octadecabacter antarcticus 307]|uniref:Putative S-adenosylmethionine uptake transporter n=1 Tax=Octadecabacter antarcticus 307 TaxID=391626 RepID=M9RDH0_9RHOB|nr:DMT family transporter [Octadecabacter antarcticus]AGI67870.1 putative S-adenosylmethionine uptake transporter [Octadecabacter antarcticus 307]
MENLRGAVFMTFSMLAFAIEDVLIKTLGARIPIGQILSVIGAGAAIAFVVWFIAKGQPVFVAAHLNGRVWARGFFEVIGTMLFLTALMQLDVTMLSAIIQATPLVVAMGGAIFLGQTVGWKRWTAILVGFVGVLIIIRPGLDGVSVATLLGIGGMLGLAGRDLATRAINVPISGAHLSLHAFLLLIPAGLVLCWLNGQPIVVMSMSDSATLAGCIAVALVAYLSIVAATRAGDAAFISMFRYTRMLFALFLGVVFLNERPDTMTLIGVGIVIAAGLFTFIREARARRTSQAVPEPL